MKFKLAKYFSLNLDYWIINISYVLLLGSCYGCQTMLITYLSYTGANANMNGVVRSVVSAIGGPGAGILVGLIGKRPMLLLICYIIAILSFLALLWYDIPSYIPVFFIGLFDGCAASLGMSLFALVVPVRQLNNAYAIAGASLNGIQFIVSPISGALNVINWPVKAAGMMLFFVFVLLIGFVDTLMLVIRDKRFYRGMLSRKPEK